MQKPCEKCPFRSDKKFHLESRERAIGFVRDILNDGYFPCHLTVAYKGEDVDKTNSSACIGSAALLENILPGGCRANVQYRLRVRSGELNPEAFDKSNVYKTAKDFVVGTSTW